MKWREQIIPQEPKEAAEIDQATETRSGGAEINPQATSDEKTTPQGLRRRWTHEDIHQRQGHMFINAGGKAAYDLLVAMEANPNRPTKINCR